MLTIQDLRGQIRGEEGQRDDACHVTILDAFRLRNAGQGFPLTLSVANCYSRRHWQLKQPAKSLAVVKIRRVSRMRALRTLVI